MLKSYYFVCLSLLFILTEYVQCDSDVRCESDARGDSDYSFNLEAGGWLKLHTAPETWEEALLKCHHRGAVLASPLNKGLAHALQQQMLQFGVFGNIFLGTHDLFSKGHFVSVEGVLLSDMDIKWGTQGNGTGTGDCLTMSADGRVHCSSCKALLPFICYKKPNECCTFDDEYHLNEQTGRCYKVHLNMQSWANAYSICKSEGGHLVVLNNAEEARIVKNMFTPPPTLRDPWEGFSIGLVSWGENRTWFTIHGESIDNVYNEWDVGEPNNSGNRNEIRAVCKFENGRLNDVPDEPYPLLFVCEKSPQCNNGSKTYRKLQKKQEKSVALL